MAPCATSLTCCTVQAAAVMFMSAARMLAAGPVPSTSSLQLQKARTCCSLPQRPGAVRAQLRSASFQLQMKIHSLIQCVTRPFADGIHDGGHGDAGGTPRSRPPRGSASPGTGSPVPRRGAQRSGKPAQAAAGRWGQQQQVRRLHPPQGRSGETFIADSHRAYASAILQSWRCSPWRPATCPSTTTCKVAP